MALSKSICGVFSTVATKAPFHSQIDLISTARTNFDLTLLRRLPAKSGVDGDLHRYGRSCILVDW